MRPPGRPRADRNFRPSLAAQGAESFKAKVQLSVSQASRSAIKAVEAAGGSIVTVYHSPLSLRAALKPHAFDIPIRTPAPPPKIKRYYVNRGNRGYLNPEVQLAQLKARLAAGMPLPLAAAVQPVYVGGAALDPERHITDIALDAPHVVAAAAAAPGPGSKSAAAAAGSA